MNNQPIYKRVKILWWIILILWGFYAWVIFAYIHQWGNNPIDKAGLLIFSVIWIMVSVFLFTNRFVLTIDDKFVIVKFGSWWDIKIHITQIKDVNVEKVNFGKYFWAYVKKAPNKGTQYLFDFTGQVLKIQTKNGKTYQITIKNAQKIKEE
jgi:hypothetical protein